jgi:predicted nuclease of predicted toxin-antitoxin system
VFEFARSREFASVSKDADFVDVAITRGAPPKIVWLRIGNASMPSVAALMRQEADAIAAFLADPAVAILALTR